MDIVERLREWKNSPLFNWADLDPSDMEEAATEIEQVRLANSDLQMYYDYAKTECDKLQIEVLKLR